VPVLVHFAFLISAHVSPGADRLARGDTLWLTVDFSDSQLDLRSNQRYRVPGRELELLTFVGFRKLSGPAHLPGSNAQDFTVVNGVGQVQPGDLTFRSFEPVYRQRYRARIVIIPQLPGVYALHLLSTVRVPVPLSLLTVSADAEENPRRAVLNDIYYIINKGKVDFDLQQQHSLLTSTKPDAP
jgi:hypothetical protein